MIILKSKGDWAGLFEFTKLIYYRDKFYRICNSRATFIKVCVRSILLRKKQQTTYTVKNKWPFFTAFSNEMNFSLSIVLLATECRFTVRIKRANKKRNRYASRRVGKSGEWSWSEDEKCALVIRLCGARRRALSATSPRTYLYGQVKNRARAKSLNSWKQSIWLIYNCKYENV